MERHNENITRLLFSLQSEKKIKFEGKSSAEDAEKFAAMLKEEEKGKSEKTQDKMKSAIHDDKKAKEEKEKEKEEKLAKMAAQSDFGLSSLLNYLYQLVIKNPDALSVSEKQMIGLKDFGKAGVDMAALNRMLAQRGLNINDLSPKEIDKLARLHEENQLSFYLDNLAKEKKSLKTAPAVTQEKEGSAQVKGVEEVKVSKDTQREEIIRQIIDQILIRNVGKKDKEIIIKMNPEYLGQLKVILEVKDNKVSAKFETTSTIVRDIITDSRRELSDALGGQKLVLSEYSADLVDRIA